ncbi:unnamed protein product, partial [Brenthis ino]
MSEDSPRKTVQRKNADQRHQSYSLKASGDSAPEKKARSKSKIRIPKRLRYDLENALVGLCDIWFEEIKPYLVRNNIKLHVHDDKGGGSGDRGEVPSTFKCSHLDPASSSHECELCKLLFNAANSIESALSQAATITAVPGGCPNTGMARIQNCLTFFLVSLLSELEVSYCNNCKKERARKPRKRRKCQQTQLRQPVPRLCRTYSIPPLTSPTEKIANTLQQISLQNNKDLIDIIAKRHEKKLELLFTSPRKDDFPSIMNLYVPPKVKRNPREFDKIPPWR